MSRYIDADALAEKIRLGEAPTSSGAMNRVRWMDFIVAQPTADVRENVHGKWIKEDSGAMYCTACGKYPLFASATNYCPWCGADMRGEE